MHLLDPLFLNAAALARSEQLRLAGACSPERRAQAAGSPAGRLQAALGRALVTAGTKPAGASPAGPC